MKYLFVSVIAVLIAGCTQFSTVSWEAPGADVVGGTLLLKVSDSSAPKNMVFLVNGVEVGKVYGEGDYTFQWDSRTVTNGLHELSAKPFGGQAAVHQVEVFNSDPVEAQPRPEVEVNLDPLEKATAYLSDPFINLPEGTWAALWRSYIARSNVPTFGLLALGDTPLPRGTLVYENETWVLQDDNAQGLSVNYAYNDGEAHDITMTILWEALSPSIMVEGANGPVEVPTGMSYEVTENDEVTTYLEIALDYAQPEGCERQLEPQQVSVTGVLTIDGVDTLVPAETEEGEPSAPEPSPDNPNGSRLNAEFDNDFQLNYSQSDAGATLELFMRSMSEDVEGIYELNVFALGDLEREACELTNILPEQLATDFSIGFGEIDGPYTGVGGEFSLTEMQGTFTGELEGKIVTFEDGEDQDRSSFKGLFDDSNQNLVPGENVVALTPSGESDLETFLLDLLGSYGLNFGE